MSYLPTTHFYIPRIEQRENNLFMEEYYSSTDTKIYINDVEQTEISYINYAVQEQLKPLYGYASRTFDDMAVGNRIVTGTFKVPIRNPEAQTPLQDILASLNPNPEDGGPGNEDYNNRQDELLNNQDWINTGGGGTTGENTYIEDDDVYAYVSKLESLGYDVDMNSTMTEIQAAIKAFQTDHPTGGEVNGILTDDVKQAIDEAFANANMETVRLEAGTTIRMGPGEIYDVDRILSEAEHVYIVKDDFEGWVMVQFSDGSTGYVEDSAIGG